MNFLQPYSKPTASDICVCFCWFNPARRIRPLQNLLLFKSRLDLAEIPYFSIECTFGQEAPQLPGATVRVQAPGPLFYKENLWNILEHHIPEQYKYLVFCDTDIFVSEGDWISKIRDSLQTYDIVHPFEKVIRLDPNMIRHSEEKGAIAEICKGHSYTIGSNAPGFSWALRRSLFRAIGGFFDRNLIGCGDQSFAHALYNQVPSLAKGRHASHLDAFMDYRKKVGDQSPNVSYLPFTLYHLWHGTLQDRQYESRLTWFNEQIPWDQWFERSSCGLWISKDAEKQKSAYQYFVRREEDSVAPGTNFTKESSQAKKTSFFDKFPNLRSS